MSNEDDTYSTMFTALKHPIRRRILRILNQTPSTYTDIQTQLGIDNGLLNYHLDNMRDLLTKGEDGRYSLSEFGEAAQSLTSRVEDPVKRRVDSATFFGHKVGGVLALVLISTLLLSNVYLAFTIQSQSKERANAIGASLIQARGLIAESVSALNATISRRDLTGTDWYALYGNLLQASSQCDSLSKLDPEHTSNWTQMRDALKSLSGFTMQLSQQTSSGLALGDSNSTSLSWVKVDSITSIRDDLATMLKAFPDVWAVTGSNLNINLNGKLSSTIPDSSSKLIADVRYARSSFYFGEPITITWADGSDAVPSSGGNVTIREVDGTFLLYTNSSGTIR